MLRRLFLIALPRLAVAVPSPRRLPTAGWSGLIKAPTPTIPTTTPKVKFVSMGKGFHVTSGPAGTYWHPNNTAMGNFTAKATFILFKPSGHTNYYGLTFGGEDLGGAKQNYIYFMVAQDGTFAVIHRSGDETHVPAR